VRVVSPQLPSALVEQPEHLRVFHLVWHLPFDLFGLGDPTSSYATADIALRDIGAHKPHHHEKVETHGGQRRILIQKWFHITIMVILQSEVYLIYTKLGTPEVCVYNIPQQIAF
jgi:hypothetical protein